MMQDIYIQDIYMMSNDKYLEGAYLIFGPLCVSSNDLSVHSKSTMWAYLILDTPERCFPERGLFTKSNDNYI